MERLAFRLYGTLVTRPALYRRAIRLARLFLRPLAGRDGQVRLAIGPLAGWTRVRDLPLPARRPFLDRVRRAGRKHRGRPLPEPEPDRRKRAPVPEPDAVGRHPVSQPPSDAGPEGGGR